MADKDEPMAPTVEPRLQALEQQMAILQQKAVQIDGKMEYLHQQVEHRLWESTDRKHGFRLPIQFHESRLFGISYVREEAHSFPAHSPVKSNLLVLCIPFCVVDDQGVSEGVPSMTTNRGGWLIWGVV